MTTYPIVCLANAGDPHRFEVAHVSPDLTCIRCGSADLDLDEAAMTATAAKDLPADPSKPDNRCGKDEQHAEHNFEFDGEEFYCDGKPYYSNQPGWETQRSSSKTAAFQPADGCLCPPPRVEDPRGDRRTHLHWEIRDDNRYVAGPFDRRSGGPGSADYAMMNYGETIGFGSTPNGPGLNIVEVQPGSPAGYDSALDMNVGATAPYTKIVGSKTAGQPGEYPVADEVHDTTSVSQQVTCSSCLTDHVVTAVDPAQPMPPCPNCGKPTLSPGGSTVASLVTEGSLDAAFASLADDIKKQFDEENPSSTEGCDICGDSGHTTAQHKADPAKYDDATRKDAALHVRVARKIDQIADGVLATNPGMNRQAALDLAAKTLKAYPAMLASEGN